MARLACVVQASALLAFVVACAAFSEDRRTVWTVAVMPSRAERASRPYKTGWVRKLMAVARARASSGLELRIQQQKLHLYSRRL